MFPSPTGARLGDLLRSSHLLRSAFPPSSSGFFDFENVLLQNSNLGLELSFVVQVEIHQIRFKLTPDGLQIALLQLSPATEEFDQRLRVPGVEGVHHANGAQCVQPALHSLLKTTVKNVKCFDQKVVRIVIFIQVNFFDELIHQTANFEQASLKKLLLTFECFFDKLYKTRGPNGLT